MNLGRPREGPEEPQILCPPYVYGYYFDMRCWCQLFIKHLKRVSWNPDAFSSVILPGEQRKTIESLVSRHRFATSVRNETELKGKGLVIVLHGPPGTGKTFTAGNSVHRPLNHVLDATDAGGQKLLQNRQRSLSCSSLLESSGISCPISRRSFGGSSDTPPSGKQFY
jgi:hypothetical protein